jgi:hypothetical protein
MPIEGQKYILLAAESTNDPTTQYIGGPGTEEEMRERANEIITEDSYEWAMIVPVLAVISKDDLEEDEEDEEDATD